jgi:hypothetical protein
MTHRSGGQTVDGQITDTGADGIGLLRFLLDNDDTDALSEGSLYISGVKVVLDDGLRPRRRRAHGSRAGPSGCGSGCGLARTTGTRHNNLAPSRPARQSCALRGSRADHAHADVY